MLTKAALEVGLGEGGASTAGCFTFYSSVLLGFVTIRVHYTCKNSITVEVENSRGILTTHLFSVYLMNCFCFQVRRKHVHLLLKSKRLSKRGDVASMLPTRFYHSIMSSFNRQLLLSPNLCPQTAMAETGRPISPLFLL